MSDVREMTNEELDSQLREVCAEMWANGFGHPNYAMFPQVVAELCDELSRRIRIMKEYCESDQECREKDFSIMPWERKKRAEAAYRAMKGERDA